MLVLPAIYHREVIRVIRRNPSAMKVWRASLVRLQDKVWWSHIFLWYPQLRSWMPSLLDEKVSRLLLSAQLYPIVPPNRPLALYGILYIGSINPRSPAGNHHILVAEDHLTKYVIALPVLNTSAEVAKEFVMEEIVLRFGVTDRILLDWDSCFT